MNIYLYTENFETQDFDVFVFDSKSKLLKRMPTGPDTQSRFKWLSEHEAPEDINSDGISTCGGSGVKAYLSFKIRIDQHAPKSGRTRLIFGSTESVWFTWHLKENIESIIEGIKILLKECSLTIPQQRMQCLQKDLEKSYQSINTKKMPFINKVVGVALLVAGGMTLAKSNRTDNLPNGENSKTDLTKNQEGK